MNIVYCTDSYRYFGGIQRVTIEKVNALAEIPGYNIYLIVSDNKTGEIPFPLSPKVNLIDLDINYYDDDWKSKLHLLKSITIKRLRHKRQMKQALKKIKPDIIIATGTSEKYFINSIKGNAKTIREIHFTSNYRDLTTHKAPTFYKLLSKLSSFIDYRLSINNYDLIAVLTQEDKDNMWKNNPKVIVMPNPVTFSSPEQSPLTEKELISIGRLCSPKNFSSLIRICAEVFKKHPDWHLSIWGDGAERNHLEKLIDTLGLNSNVFLPGSTNKISEKLLKSSIFVLSSDYEGFGIVIVEAEECGLPIVSFACPYGPKDIITDGKNGFLIPPGDEDMFAQRICQLIENKELRCAMGNEAKLNASKYSSEKIINRWCEVFENLVAQTTNK